MKLNDKHLGELYLGMAFVQFGLAVIVATRMIYYHSLPDFGTNHILSIKYFIELATLLIFGLSLFAPVLYKEVLKPRLEKRRKGE